MIRTYQLITSSKINRHVPKEFARTRINGITSLDTRGEVEIKERYYFYDYSTGLEQKLPPLKCLEAWKRAIVNRTGKSCIIEIITYEKALDRVLLRHLSFTFLHHQYTVFKCLKGDTVFWFSLEKTRKGIIAQYSEGTDLCSTKFIGENRENVKVRRYHGLTNSQHRRHDDSQVTSIKELINNFHFCLPYSLTSSNCKDLAKLFIPLS